MAYQNVGTPRFYINTMEWLHSVGGLIDDRNLDLVLTIPSNILDLESLASTFSTWNTTPNPHGWNDTLYFPRTATPLSELIGAKGFVAHLGHNYASCEVGVRLDQGSPNWNSAAFTEDIVNVPESSITILNPTTEDSDTVGDSMKTSYDGFSIYLADYTNQSAQSNPRIRCDYYGSGTPYNGSRVEAGSIILGSYYDMPHSPDLNLTMTREYGGIKTIETKGGASLSNAFYTKPAMWGEGGAWELYSGTPNHALARSGRRVWDLSFSYLQNSDIFPAYSSLQRYGTYEDWDDVTEDTLLVSDNFFSQVIHKTNGGQLPFIFQPDSSNNNPDQFAICKFDQKSFQFKQVANGIYNVKLKIREVW